MNNFKQNLNIDINSICHDKLRFSQKSTRVQSYSIKQIGGTAIKIKYIICNTEPAHIPKCYYSINIEKYYFKKDIILCYVTLPNKKYDESLYLNSVNEKKRYLENKANEAAHNLKNNANEKKPRLRNKKPRLKNKATLINEEIKAHWIKKYNRLPEAIQKFFYIKNPYDIKSKRGPNDEQLILKFNKWKEDFENAIEWQSEFPNIIKFMEERSETSNNYFNIPDTQLKIFIDQIVEIDEIIIKYPKKLLFIKSIGQEVEVYYNQLTKKLSFDMEIVDIVTNKSSNKKIPLNDDEAEEFLPLFDDVIKLIEVKNELTDKLNQERKNQTLIRQLELQQIAEKYLPQELMKYIEFQIC